MYFFKKIIFLTLISFLSLSCSTIAKQRQFVDYNDPNYHEKILATDTNSISEEQFYQYEHAVIAGFTGSGGHFLGEQEIEWLRKAENIFKARKIKLKDKYDRHFVIADSYFNHGVYDKAIEEFRYIKDQGGIELAEWFINNNGIKNGVIKIREYPGRIQFDASEITKAEDKNYLFVAYFKGPIYRYDKRKEMHAIIYAPEDKYDWCNALAFDGENLVSKLRDDAGTFIFSNNTHEISQLVGAYDVSLNQVAIFYGAYFYDLPEDSWVEELRYSAEKDKLAVFVKYRKKDDSPAHKIVVMNRDGTNSQEITAESFAEFSKPAAAELYSPLETRLKEFIERRFESHAGILGGFVKYGF